MEKIAFITDIHLDEQFPIDHGIDAKENWRKVIADLKSRKINKIIFGGDIGAETGHDFFFKTLEDFNFKLILGNHDNFHEVSKFYNPNKTHNELYYSIDDQYNRFIFLDTSTEKLSKIQLNWLQENLQTEKCILLFIHHPILEVQTPIDKLFPLKNRNEIKEILEKSKNQVTIFCGHYHMNDERIENNIKQIITQASSYQIEKETDEITIAASRFGYRIIKIEKNLIETELVNL